MSHLKTYLGDGVFADYDGFALVLTTEDGVRTTNRIVLEPAVYAQVVEYVRRLERAKPAETDDSSTDSQR
jgi:hypothetical protein